MGEMREIDALELQMLKARGEILEERIRILNRIIETVEDRAKILSEIVMAREMESAELRRELSVALERFSAAERVAEDRAGRWGRALRERDEARSTLARTVASLGPLAQR
jgi:biopolymer transport protein ExbB/TolQ